MKLKKTVERIVPGTVETREEFLLYLRHYFAYEQVVNRLDESSRILEIGFGEGYGADLMAGKAASVTGLDVHLRAVEYANQVYGCENCRFEHYPGEELPYADDTFDAVVSFQVIEHIEDDEGYLREINRVLKKGRPAFLTTPNRETRLKPGEKPWNSFHVREYSSEQLRHLLNRHFHSVEVLGVRGEERVESIETNRVRRRLSLYKLTPNSLKRFFTEDFENQYDTDSFYLAREDVPGSMDLFAIVEK